MSAATLFDDPDVLVARRQAQLRVPLSATQAAAGTDSDVAGSDARLLAAAAGLPAVRWIFDPRQLAALTGQPTPASIWAGPNAASTHPSSSSTSPDAATAASRSACWPTN